MAIKRRMRSSNGRLRSMVNIKVWIVLSHQITKLNSSPNSLTRRLCRNKEDLKALLGKKRGERAEKNTASLIKPDERKVMSGRVAEQGERTRADRGRYAQRTRKYAYSTNGQPV